jgi:hypothetical protein
MLRRILYRVHFVKEKEKWTKAVRDIKNCLEDISYNELRLTGEKQKRLAAKKEKWTKVLAYVIHCKKTVEIKCRQDVSKFTSIFNEDDLVHIIKELRWRRSVEVAEHLIRDLTFQLLCTSTPDKNNLIAEYNELVKLRADATSKLANMGIIIESTKIENSEFDKFYDREEELKERRRLFYRDKKWLEEDERWYKTKLEMSRLYPEDIRIREQERWSLNNAKKSLEEDAVWIAEESEKLKEDKRLFREKQEVNLSQNNFEVMDVSFEQKIKNMEATECFRFEFGATGTIIIYISMGNG